MADPLTFEACEVVRREDGSPCELERGAMGVTYKAWDRRLHCPLALKVTNLGLLDAPQIPERFLREAHAAHLHHPNVASILQFAPGTRMIPHTAITPGFTLRGPPAP